MATRSVTSWTTRTPQVLAPAQAAGERRQAHLEDSARGPAASRPSSTSTRPLARAPAAASPAAPRPACGRGSSGGSWPASAAKAALAETIRCSRIEHRDAGGRGLEDPLGVALEALDLFQPEVELAEELGVLDRQRRLVEQVADQLHVVAVERRLLLPLKPVSAEADRRGRARSAGRRSGSRPRTAAAAGDGGSPGERHAGEPDVVALPEVLAQHVEGDAAPAPRSRSGSPPGHAPWAS